MKKSLYKNAVRGITSSKSRFFSIFAIVAIGIGFLSGVKAGGPDLRISADKYFDDNNLSHFRVVSTYGLNDNDISAVKTALPNAEIYPAYALDVMASDETGALPVHVMSLQNLNENNPYNSLVLKEGRLPEKEDECLLDAQHHLADVKVGDTITFSSGSDKDITDSFKNTTYTVSGFFLSPMYISNSSKGTTNIGNGTISALIYVPKENFTIDYYTEMYVNAGELKDIMAYSEEYDDIEKPLKDSLETVATAREKERFAEIKNEADEKLSDAKKELATAKTELSKKNQEFLDAKAEFADKKLELADGEKEIEDGKSEIASAKAEIADKKAELLDGKKEAADKEKEISDGFEKIKATKVELNENKIKIRDGRDEFEAGKKEVLSKITAGEAQLNAAETELLTKESELLALKDTLPVVPPEVTAGLAQIEAGKTELAAKRRDLEIQKTAAENQLAEAEKPIILGEQKIKEAETEIAKNEAALIEGQTQINQAKQTISDGEAEIKKAEQKLSDSEKELIDGEKEIFDGKQKLLDGEKEMTDAEEKIKEAEEKLLDAEKEIKENEDEVNDLKEPEWYVLPRSSNQSYSEYSENATRVDNIAAVFPLFFILVAALVCLTTMSRMIEEERLQIGTLKALGYRNRDIVFKYMLYAQTATIAGAIAGLLVGMKLFPFVIISAYGSTLYNITELQIPYDLTLSAICIAVAIISVAVVVFFSCKEELHEQPAQLIRPKPPKNGKRIFLERINFIWSKMNFSNKVSFRNIFRYKRRMLMTVIGIAGCTALTLTGFALRDSISDVLFKQYNEIAHNDGMVAFENYDDLQKTKDIFTDFNLTSTAVYQKSVEVIGKKRTLDAYVIAPENNEEFAQFITLRSRQTKELYKLSDNGVIATEKMCQLLGVGVGDEINIKNGDIYKNVKITSVCENYPFHYIYMTKQLYENIYGEKPDFTISYFKGITDETESAFSEKILDEGALSVISNAETKRSFESMLNALNIVIIVIIISAGALAFVVLYNLTNININERIREISTLKVLGFYDKEVDKYVFRENLMLTFMGTIAGLVLGFFLAHFVISTVEVDMVMFGRDIHPLSYLWAALITLCFSVFVSLFMHKHLIKINMIEALKSVE